MYNCCIVVFEHLKTMLSNGVLLVCANVFFRDRENLILAYVVEFSYLSTSQIAELAFPFPSGITKCREVMKRMYDRKQVCRFREREFIYHLGRKRSGWQSVVMLNNLYFDIRKKGRVIQFQSELEFMFGRCDGFFVVEYEEDRKKFFVEIDRGTAPFNKAKIYNALLQTDWDTEDWADPLKRGVISFPLVLVLTLRKNVVERDFKRANFKYYVTDLYKPIWSVIFEK